MKIGLLSFAHHHAQSYLPALRRIPGVEVIGFADDDAGRAERIAAQFALHRFESDAALLSERPDAVVVCSENSRHRRLVEAAAAAGAHVLCEKPLATRLGDAQAMVAACQRADVKLMTAFPMRFSTPLVDVKARLDAGDLGRVLAFNATNQGEMPGGYGAWFVDKEQAGGGAVMDHTVHLADIMRWYLGSEVVEVYAQTNHIFHAEAVSVETGGLLLLTFANGVFASVDCSWSKPPYYPTWGGLGFELVTDRGAVLVDAFKQNLTVYRQNLQRAAWGYWGSDANQAMLEEFVEAVRQDRAPRVTGIDGLRAVEVTLAAYASAESGRPVRLQPTAPSG